MTRVSSLVAAASAVLLLTSSAQAAGQCGKRTDMVETLAQQFHENPVAVGVVNAGAVLEIFASESGTWTILATGTDGRSCVLSTGDGWEAEMLAALPEA